MKKIFTLLMLVLLSKFAYAAEQSGVIIGVHFAKGFASSEAEITTAPNTSLVVKAPNHDGWRYGIMFGYEEFASPELGVRYYGIFDFGSKYTNGEETDAKGGYSIFTYNFNFNVDVIRDFLLASGMRYGFFAGLNAGYADSRLQLENQNERTVAGLDFGFNTGFRAGYERVTIEIYGRFSVYSQEGKVNEDSVKQPYQVGLRLIYTF